MEGTRIVRIPDELYDAIERRIGEYGFKTVDEYVTFMIQELIQKEESDLLVFSEKEEEKVKKRLRSLGYIE